MEGVRYPFIQTLSMNNQELTVEDLTVFIERHSGTLRTLELSGNFLEKGLFDLMNRSKILLNSFSFSQVSLKIDEFASFGNVSTYYLKVLQLNSDGLTDNHILKMLEVKAPGPYFPKL